MKKSDIIKYETLNLLDKRKKEPTVKSSLYTKVKKRVSAKWKDEYQIFKNTELEILDPNNKKYWSYQVRGENILELQAFIVNLVNKYGLDYLNTSAYRIYADHFGRYASNAVRSFTVGRCQPKEFDDLLKKLKRYLQVGAWRQAVHVLFQNCPSSTSSV